MRIWLIALGAVVVLALPSTGTAGMSAAETDLLHEVNVVRMQHGLAPLRFDRRLERAARAHSREMLAANAFSHGAFASRMARYDIQGSLAGENLAWGTGYRGTARAIVAAWLASPEHRANLLRASFTRIGIGSIVGVFLGNADARIVTADFAG